ncbi:MAG: stage III sporulation protein AF [Oscillospiraceae bacterium]
MTELFGEWIRAIAGAALIASVAISLTPSGKTKNVLRLICGVVLIIAMISPVIKPNMPAISMDMAKYRQNADELLKKAEESTNNLSRSIIEQESEAYILDKAQSMGIAINSVCVTAKWGDEGYWYPNEIEIVSNISPGEKNRLSNSIEAELGVSKDRQYWSAYEG